MTCPSSWEAQEEDVDLAACQQMVEACCLFLQARPGCTGHCIILRIKCELHLSRSYIFAVYRPMSVSMLKNIQLQSLISVFGWLAAAHVLDELEG